MSKKSDDKNPVRKAYKTRRGGSNAVDDKAKAKPAPTAANEEK